MTNEHTLILELCKFANPNKEKIADLLAQPQMFPYVLGQLCWHRMGGAAYCVLRECGLLGNVNREFRNTLKTVHDGGVLKARAFKDALSMMAGVLDGADFPYALLKGAYLASLYPEGLRTSNDIDILTDEKNLSAAEKLLKSAGFTQGNIRFDTFTPASRAEIISSRMNRGEVVPYIREIGLPGMHYLEIDLNFSLDFKAKQKNDAVPALLLDAHPLIETANGSLFTLCPADFLLHLCCHLYKEAATYAWVAMERDLSLYKFADLYLLLREWTDGGIYDALAARAAACGQQRAVYYAMLRTKELFDLENSALDGLLTAVKPEEASFVNEVFRPEQNKTYRYDGDFPGWLFMSGRKNKLYEA